MVDDARAFGATSHLYVRIVRSLLAKQLAFGISLTFKEAVHLQQISATTHQMAELSEAQAAVYDRQLRVWGIEVQKRCARSCCCTPCCCDFGDQA